MTYNLYIIYRKELVLVCSGCNCFSFCSTVHIKHTMPIYRTSATILIDETEDRPLLDNSELLQGLGLPRA